MKTRTFKFRVFACCSIASLLSPWPCFCGNGGSVSARPLPLEVLIERFNQTEEKGVAYDKANPPSDNWGGECAYACQLVNAMGKQGDRAALLFLEEKSLSSNTCRTVRSRAAETYANLATAEECAAFLPKIFTIGNEEKSAGGWRNKVTPAGLAKIDAAIAKRELPDEIVARFLTTLLMFAQSTDNSWEAKNADDFLSKHCEGYPSSKQRVALWHTIVTTGNEWSKEKYAPLSESLDAIPSRKRIDLRDRFPGLPPLPGEKADRSPIAIVLAVGAGLAAACAAIWFALKRRRTRKHADGQPNLR